MDSHQNNINKKVYNQQKNSSIILFIDKMMHFMIL